MSQIVINTALARKLISQQFQEYKHLPIVAVDHQGHDNRTYKLGNKMLIRMPTNEIYALKVSIEQQLLPQLAPYLPIAIPLPIAMGQASEDYPYPFSLYTWIEGQSLNAVSMKHEAMQQLALDMAQFLIALQNIPIAGPQAGKHNYYRGAHISIYDRQMREQLDKLTDVIDTQKALTIWKKACITEYQKSPVWIHGDFAVGNILVWHDKLVGVIDFGGMAIGDPACDLVIAYTFLTDDARAIFIDAMKTDQDTWLRAQAWALWKASYELCASKDKKNQQASEHIRTINDILSPHT